MRLRFNKFKFGKDGPWGISLSLVTKKRERYFMIDTPDRIQPRTTVIPLPSITVTWINAGPEMKHINIFLSWIVWRVTLTYSSSMILIPEDWEEETADTQ